MLNGFSLRLRTELMARLERPDGRLDKTGGGFDPGIQVQILSWMPADIT